MDEVVSASLATRQFSASLVAAFATVALFHVSIEFTDCSQTWSSNGRVTRDPHGLVRTADVSKMILGKGP